MANFVSARSARRAVGVFASLLSLLACSPGREKSVSPPPVVVPEVKELAQGRWIEPRLSSAKVWVPCQKTRVTNHVLDQTTCGSPYFNAGGVSLSNEECEKRMTTYGEALRLLVTRPECIDASVGWLEDQARITPDAHILSDLAAATYVRAQRDDRPADLLRSLDAARRAVAVNPNLPAAEFNLALAEDELGFSTEADAAWEKAAGLDRTEWATDAAAHRAEIERAATQERVTQWEINRKLLPEALSRDRRAVAQLIRPYPAAAQNLLEEELLPAWGNALLQGRGDQARGSLRDAAVIAAALSSAEVTGDPYMRDVLARINATTGGDLRRLAEGHVAYGKARAADRAYEPAKAEEAYRRAWDLLSRARSPLAIGAKLGLATVIARFHEDKSEARTKLDEVAAESSSRGYRNPLARSLSNQANLQQIEGRYLDAINSYKAAAAIFEQMKDEENLANVHIRKAGVFRVIGQEEAALGEALVARRYAARVVEMPTRHLLAGEMSSTVLALA